MATVDPFGLPPEEAIRWFRAKGYALSFDWRDIWGEEHARAFTVAKATQQDIVDDLRAAVDRAIAEGLTLQQFRKELKPILQSKGWWGEKEMVDPKTGEKKLVQLGSSRRLRTIYQANLRTAMAAGRWERAERLAEQEREAGRQLYLRYVAILDGRERREHAAWHNTILPIDDPWWATHTPPNGWGCRCRLMTLTERQLGRYGFTPSASAPLVQMVAWENKRTGKTIQVPAGIDPGWAQNPGKHRVVDDLAPGAP